MKNSIHTTITTICAVVISLSATAQHRSRGNEPLANNNQSGSNNQKHYGGGNHGYNHHGNNHHWNGWHSGVSINIGTGPAYGNNNYGNGYYNNYYSSKKAARYALKKSANVIREALQFSNWNDIYSPWLAKAIRHQQYAKQLYFWGNYAGAINHSERAGFLAWNTLSYFNNANGYNNGFNYDDDFGYSNYQDPYQDPNNPYYRKSNLSDNTTSSSPNTNNTNNEDDFGYKKANTSTNNAGTANTPNTTTEMKKAELDMQLPADTKNDKELLKVNATDLDIE